MKKTTIYFLAGALVMGSLTSCSEKFLEIDPEQSVATNNAITDVNTLQTALNGTYSKLQGSGYYGRSVYVIPELMADNLYLSLRNTGRYLDYHNFIVREQDSYAEDLWNTAYEVVINATRAIQGGEALMLNGAQQEEANQMIGEAYTLRALAHFDLTRFFAQPFNFSAGAGHGGVPVIETIGDDPISPSRNTVKEDFDLIISDLTKAIELMSEATANGTLSSNATKALLARAYLYTEQYELAADMATEVIESGDYALLASEDYSTIWSEDYNAEVIFEIVNTIADNAGTNGLGHFFDEAGYADALVTEGLYGIYSDSDVRKSAIERKPKSGAEDDALFVMKFPQGALQDDDVKILRIAEVFLIRAEAYAQSGQPIMALEDLNTIVLSRDPEANPVVASGDALLLRILDERRKELAFEGHRLFDLNRNKMNVNIDQGVAVIEESYPNDRFILPIPLSELNANPNIAPQNPDY
ncbi:RagB/SusD family nutrient uptake outer membrane protein [Echinicola shivajiensis]|uniref:RagB/SusD family nutrient uptake outer membrane protein n=1 Tax=Echinicola shivajiensis TaxID=1035916 RepID=UPI001BFC48CA|nr:RagB/SusD family nutrient uptake outer membrane protein [Echinicola shivajiensis]